MLGLTLPGPEQTCLPESTYSGANITANKSQWRPHTSRSGRSARSASPLFARWARRHHQYHQQLDAHESNDSRLSTDRKNTSSDSNSKSAFQQHHHHPGARNNDDASHKHTANFSAWTASRPESSFERHSESAVPPPLTREEFEALPLAIQRKVRALSFVCHICTFATIHAYRPASCPLASAAVGIEFRTAFRHPMGIAVPCIS